MLATFPTKEEMRLAETVTVVKTVRTTVTATIMALMPTLTTAHQQQVQR
jgi:hypothetical protein